MLCDRQWGLASDRRGSPRTHARVCRFHPKPRQQNRGSSGDRGSPRESAHVVLLPGLRPTANYLFRHPGRGFGGFRGSFVIGDLGTLKAQVHLMQPQGLPAVGRVPTATEPRPQTGCGCLPAHGPGGQSLPLPALSPTEPPRPASEQRQQR
jgi:hypothetical protein